MPCDKEAVEALSADDKQRQLTTFLFLQSQPLDVVKKAVKLAREDRQAFEDECLLPFALAWRRETRLRKWTPPVCRFRRSHRRALWQEM